MVSQKNQATDIFFSLQISKGYPKFEFGDLTFK